MSKQTADHQRLTPRERLSRGLAYSALGPVDVTRGVVGLGTHSAHSTASALRRHYQRGRLARDIGELELASAPEVVSKLPQTLRDTRKSRRRRGKRPLLITGAAVLALAGGAAAFSKVRRSSQPDYYEQPAPRPPSVDVEHRP